MRITQPGEELLVRMPGDGGHMTDNVIDGRYNDPEGRSKTFVRRRDDETDDDFAERAMEMLSRAGHPFADVQDEAPSDDLTDQS